MAFVTTKVASEKLGVHSNTLRLWDKLGKIKTIRTPGNNRLYDLSSLESTQKKKIIYIRVSSRNQKDDLRNQIEYVRKRYPNHEYIEDIGSGLNFKRKGLKVLLESIMSGDVEEVVVAHKDRLCRFGFELIEQIASQYNTRIVVLSESKLSPQEEIVQDLLSIIHVFSCRLYGLRRYSREIKEDKNLSKKGKSKSSK